MQFIQSAANATIKRIKSLKDKKHRETYRQYMLEGEKMVKEAIDAKAAEIVAVQEGLYHNLLFEAEQSGAEVYIMPKNVFNSVCDVKTPQGILAVAPIPDIVWAPEKCYGHVVALENVQDPGNVGTVIRSAEAAGFCAVILCGQCADPYNPKAVRSAMGSLLRVPVFTSCTEKHIQDLKNIGYTVIAGDLDGGSTYKKTDRVALLVGNEANGLSSEMLSLADVRLKLPMQGQVDSLNAAVFASVMMYIIAGTGLTQ